MNETLLNLSVLRESFDKYFDDKYVLKYWFTKLLHTSTVMGVMDEYWNFGELAEVVLENLFFESGKTLTPEIKTDILGSFRKLPAYDDVAETLKILRRNNIKTIAVSNSSLEMIKEQLTNAEIVDYTAAPIFMDGKEKGAHEWIIEFKSPPDDLNSFTQLLDSALQEVNSDYEAKRFNNITLNLPKIHHARERLFYDWLKQSNKLGGQHKVPKVSNERKNIDEILEIIK